MEVWRGVPPKIATFGKRSLSGISRCRYSQGASTYKPQMPYTTLGMAASSSTPIPIAPRNRGREDSARNRATPTPTGSARARARKAVTTVPKM